MVCFWLPLFCPKEKGYPERSMLQHGIGERPLCTPRSGDSGFISDMKWGASLWVRFEACAHGNLFLEGTHGCFFLGGKQKGYPLEFWESHYFVINPHVPEKKREATTGLEIPGS